MRKYRLVAKKGEGTFSEVLKAQNVKDGKYHAIKCMKSKFDSIDQVNNLREIQALRRLSPHDHVITLEEVLYDQPTGRLALVFELMDANLYELIRGRRHYLNPQLIKSYMWQLMKSLDHMHKKGIFHRDIKPENILIESSTDVGKGLKLADFGSCRGIYSKQPYTEYISTRWYRAPECLLTDGYYGPEMDLWGAGCVMFEITSLYPLYPGTNEVDQISRIHKVLGTPSPEILAKLKSKGASHISFDFPEQKGIGIGQLIPHASPDLIDLVVKLLKYDASERITSREAMRHPYFKEIREVEVKRLQSDTTGQSAVAAVAAVVAGNGANSSSSVAGSLTGIKPSNSIASQMSIPSQQQSTGNKAPQPNAGKAFPNILGGSDGFKSSQQAQQNMIIKPVGAAVKANTLTSGTNASIGGSTLPPIGGGGMFSPGGQSQNIIEQKSVRSLQQQQQQINGTAGSGALAGSNGLKKKKKYRGYGGGYQQQAQPSFQQQQFQSQQRAVQGETLGRAYGLPRNNNAAAGGGGAGSNLDTSSKALNGDSKFIPAAPTYGNYGAGAGAGAGAARYPAANGKK